MSGLIKHGHNVTALELAKAHQLRLGFSNELRGIFRKYDLLLIPATIWPTPTVQTWNSFSGADNSEFVRFTAPFDLSGSPTITLPSGFDKRGMPLAIQLVGDVLRDDLVLTGGAAYQRVTDWHLKRPKI